MQSNYPDGFPPGVTGQEPYFADRLMHCRACGKRHDGDGMFCRDCGKDDKADHDMELMRDDALFREDDHG